MRYKEHLDDVGRFLTLAVRGSRTASEQAEFEVLYHTLGYETCRSAAKRNQVEAMVAYAVITSFPAAEPEWIEFVRANEVRVRDLTSALVSVLDRLEAAGCPSAVVENAGVLFGSNLPMTAFCAGDFDLVVDKSHWATVQQAFADEGFRAADRRNRPTNRMEYCKRLPDGRELWINPGYLSFDRMWVPLDYRDRTPIWLGRRVPSTTQPSIHVLAPPDALAFVAMHTSLHSFVRPPGIRLHTDVDRLVRDNMIDWDQFLQEVFAMGVSTRAFVSLTMAAALLGTPIPEQVLQRLYPGDKRWRAIARLLARNGVFVTGKKKLPHIYAVYLDALLDERGFWPWFRSVTFPPTSWLREHFDRDGQYKGTPWKLHIRRSWLLLTSWRH